MLDFFNDNFYSVIAAISLAVHLVINWKQLFVRERAGARAGVREFRQFLAVLTVFFVTDVLWGLLEKLRWRGALYANTLFFFLAMAVSISFWTRFIVAYMGMDGLRRRLLLLGGRTILAFFVGALAVNAFTGHFFTIDAASVYSAGPVRQVAFSLLAAFNAYASVGTLLRLPGTRGAARRHCKMFIAVGATMTAAILLQLCDPFLPLYGLGTLFSLCLLHVFVVEDERDEMHRQELLARTYEAELEAERAANRAKSLFFSSVSHDIRTPLNAIVGFSELLERGGHGEADGARYVSSIRSSAKVLARLVDDILDLSKMESGKLEIIEEPTDVPALAREVIAACEVSVARKPIALRAEIGPMPRVEVDPQRIRQLLFNLLSNACKYTDRGTVTVRVRWDGGGTLSLAVEDTGKGISRADIDRILQPFVQLADRNHRDGTGLGLPICQRLASLMGGELAVESEVGRGSTFTVTLPNVRIAAPPAAPGAPAAATGTAPAGRPARAPGRILVVDDSPVNRAVLKAMLEKCGAADIAMARNGLEALEVLRTGPAFDLVLTDLWMPGMDGFGLVAAIRAEAALAHLPVYLVTADVGARNQAGSDGFTGILLKPVTLDRLQAFFTQDGPPPGAAAE